MQTAAVFISVTIHSLQDFYFSFSELLEKMFRLFVFCCLCFWHLVVFADPDAVKSVPVTEGESVTLNTGLTELQKLDLITWTFGHSQTQIAKINKEEGNVSTFDGTDGRFRGRLKLDHQTGSLTIMNTRTTDSGNYTVNIKGTNQTTYRFNVTVCVSESQTALVSSAVAGSLLIVAAVGIFCIYRRHRKTDQEGTDQTCNEEITYAEPTFNKRKAHKPRVKQEDEVLYAGVVMRN